MVLRRRNCRGRPDLRGFALALLFLLSGRYMDRIVLVFPLWVLLISIIS
jgi:hypothetical protein